MNLTNSMGKMVKYDDAGKPGEVDISHSLHFPQIEYTWYFQVMKIVEI